MNRSALCVSSLLAFAGTATAVVTLDTSSAQTSPTLVASHSSDQSIQRDEDLTTPPAATTDSTSGSLQLDLTFATHVGAGPVASLGFDIG